MITWLGKMVQQVIVVVSVLFFLQLPLFMKAYEHQLVGHVVEIKRHITTMQENARVSGKSLEQYIQKFVKSEDKDFSKQGRDMLQMDLRAKKLTQALDEFQQAEVYARPFIFVRYIDLGIAYSTLQSFEPGLSLTIESVAYAFLGILVGFLVAAALFRLVRRRARGSDSVSCSTASPTGK